MKHFGDPCVHCATPHDDVPPGPCLGDPAKAKPIRYRSLEVRWDNVEHFLIEMSSGVFEDRHEHTEMQLPYTYLKDATYTADLKRAAESEEQSRG